jgi:hypothetical protein
MGPLPTMERKSSCTSSHVNFDGRRTLAALGLRAQLRDIDPSDYFQSIKQLKLTKRYGISRIYDKFSTNWTVRNFLNSVFKIVVNEKKIYLFVKSISKNFLHHINPHQ